MTAVAHNKLMECNIDYALQLYYDGKLVSQARKPISVVDAYCSLRHACIYGPTVIDYFDCGTITYSRFPTDAVKTKITVDGRRVTAEKEMRILAGTTKVIRPLLHLLQLFPCNNKEPIDPSCLRGWNDPSADHPFSSDAGSIHSYDKSSYLPALLLSELDFLTQREREILLSYDIDATLLEQIKSKRGPGSWLNIVAAVELWMEGQSSLKEALESI